jgi:hypothetical protein
MSQMDMIPDELKGALQALRRAREIARQTAIDTNTNLVIFKEGKLTLVTPEELKATSSENPPAKP